MPLTIQEQIDRFKFDYPVQAIIAISGGSEAPEEEIRPIVDEVIRELADYGVAILHGGTTWSIQKMANDIAMAWGMPTIGVLPRRGEKYLNIDATLSIIVEPRCGPSEWSDEADVFAKLADGVIMIGGGTGTLAEFSHIIKINESRLAHPEEGPPIYLAPVISTGGVADLSYDLIFRKSSLAAIPFDPIFSGYEAARFIISKLDLQKIC